MLLFSDLPFISLNFFFSVLKFGASIWIFQENYFMNKWYKASSFCVFWWGIFSFFFFNNYRFFFFCSLVGTEANLFKLNKILWTLFLTLLLGILLLLIMQNMLVSTEVEIALLNCLEFRRIIFYHLTFSWWENTHILFVLVCCYKPRQQ